MMKPKILIIDDDRAFYLLIKTVLKDVVETRWAETGATGVQSFSDDIHGYATVLIDYMLPDLKGSDVAQHIKKLNSEQNLLFSTGYRDLTIWQDLLEVGSSGFLFKGAPEDEIRSKIMRSVQFFRERHRLVGAQESDCSVAEARLRLAGFIGRSSLLYSVLNQIERARESQYPVLIIGETGSGKELVARALVPKDKTCVPVTCPSFIGSEQFLESHLFGHIKGAFTGADKDRVGLVAQAHGNVLYLDELHQLPVGCQAKLLRFLQEMKYRRVGDTNVGETNAKFRLISAIQPDVTARLSDGRFLPDLVERVSTLKIRVPSLRERPEDIEPLVRHFQNEYNAATNGKRKKQFRISTISAMEKHLWPTNVRGLQNAVKSMLTYCDEEIVEPKHFQKFLKGDILCPPLPLAVQVNTKPLGESKREFERTRIIEALSCSRTRKEAAARLSVPLSTFTRKLEKLEIEAETFLKSQIRDSRNDEEI